MKGDNGDNSDNGDSDDDGDGKGSIVVVLYLLVNRLASV